MPLYGEDSFAPPQPVVVATPAAPGARVTAHRVNVQGGAEFAGYTVGVADGVPQAPRGAPGQPPQHWGPWGAGVMPPGVIPVGNLTEIHSPGPVFLPMGGAGAGGVTQGLPGGLTQGLAGAPRNAAEAAALTAAGLAAAQGMMQGEGQGNMHRTTTAPVTPEAAATTGTAAGVNAGAATDRTTDRWKRDLLEKPVALRMWKQRAVARLIVPGALAWDVNDKHHFPAGALKPTIEAMQWELLHRDPSAASRNYRSERLCKRLHELPVPAGTPPIIIPTDPEGGVGDGDTTGAGGGSGMPRSSRGWKAKLDLPRLCHVIVDLKEDFLKRDAKPKNRGELEAVPRNVFWQKASHGSSRACTEMALEGVLECCSGARTRWK